MSRIKTETKSGKVVETFGLTQEQHDYAVEAVEKDLRHIGDYSIEEVDEEMAEVWMEDSEDEDYKDLLSIGLEQGEVLTLCSMGQELGEIVVY